MKPMILPKRRSSSTIISNTRRIKKKRNQFISSSSVFILITALLLFIRIETCDSWMIMLPHQQLSRFSNTIRRRMVLIRSRKNDSRAVSGFGGSSTSKSKVIFRSRMSSSSSSSIAGIPNHRDKCVVFSTSSSTTKKEEINTTTTSKISEEIKEESEEDEIMYNKLKDISSEIIKHDALYYTTGEETAISDEEYDSLVKEEEILVTTIKPNLLDALEKESGLGLSTTRRGRIGFLDDSSSTASDSDSDSNGNSSNVRRARQHLVGHPMMSLDNALEMNDVERWLLRTYKEISNPTKKESSSVTILAEPKLDGLSLSLHYELVNDNEYALEWAATRGNGYNGEDVTHAIHDCITIPKTIHIHSASSSDESLHSIEIRGEILLPPLALQHYLTTRQTRISTTSTSNTNNETTSIPSSNETNAQKQESSNTTAISNASFLEGLPLFSNARNAASGVLRRFKTKHMSNELTTLRQSLSFYAYDFVIAPPSPDSSFLVQDDAVQMRTMLQSIGFQIPEPHAVTTISFQNDTTTNYTTTPRNMEPITEYYQNILQNRNVKYPFEMDGVVLKYTNFTHRQALGNTNKAPKWSIAYKFPYHKTSTKLLNIIHQVGRTGVITPVAILQPVHLNGVLIQRATLHNYHYIQQLFHNTDTTSISSGNTSISSIPNGYDVTAFIARAGDVIPQVMQCIVQPSFSSSHETAYNHTTNDDLVEEIVLHHPLVCPACNAPTIFQLNAATTTTATPTQQQQPSMIDNNTIISSNNNQGKKLICSNEKYYKCPPRAIGILSHAYSKNGLDIVGLSDGRIKQLYDANIIQFPCDLFTLLLPHDDHVDDESNTTQVQQQKQEIIDKIKDLPKWGNKSIHNLIQSLHTTSIKPIPFHKFIYSLGINHVGLYVSQIVATCFSNDVDLFFHSLNEFSTFDIDDVVDIDYNTTTATTTDIPVNCNNTSTISSQHDNDNSYYTNPSSTKAALSLLQNQTGIGPVIISSLVTFAKDDVSLQAAKTLSKCIPIITMDQLQPLTAMESSQEENKPWYGRNVVITGSIPGYTRNQVQTIAKNVLGAKSTPTTITSSKTDLVVCGEKAGPKKIDKCKAFNITVITTDEFLNLVQSLQEDERK